MVQFLHLHTYRVSISNIDVIHGKHVNVLSFCRLMTYTAPRTMSRCFIEVRMKQRAFLFPFKFPFARYKAIATQ